MTSRLFALFGTVALLTGLASAQDKPVGKDKPTAKAQVKEALETANEDLPKAIKILEKGLEAAPEDREALYLLGAMATVQAEQIKDKTERIAMFHKATATFARFDKLFKDPTQFEKQFKARSLVGEARALALEGKPKDAIESLKQAMTLGFDDVGSVDQEEDFATVRKLPELKTLLASAYKMQVDQAKKELAEEMSQTQAFPFDFELKDTDDKNVALADFKGKVTIVDVWGTWCPPCRKEIPHFVDLYREYKDKGLAIVGINCNEQGTRDEVKKTIKKFAKETSIEYPCVLNDDKTEAKIPGFQGYPTTLFIDKAGKIRLVLVGYTAKPKLEAIITTLLADTGAPAAEKATEKVERKAETKGK